MGTTFKIYLPQVEGEASKFVSDDHPQRLLGGNETVLLAEDEDIVRDLSVRILDKLGYTDNAIVHHGVLDESVSFIGKPYSPSALAKKIREVLDDEG